MKIFAKILTIVTVVIISLIALFTYQYRDNIYLYLRDNVLKERENIKIKTNEYTKSDDFLFVKNTNDFIAKDKEHIRDILYTILNSGNPEFTFYCDDNYSTCIDDIVDYSNDKITLSNINNFVHPYNSFKKIYISYTNHGEITVEIEKNYSKNEINELNDIVDKIIKDEIAKSMSDKEKISIIHDYIIKNGEYATDDILESDSNISFNKANHLLFDGYGLCSSYSDAMVLFLEEFDIPNYKIASDTHIWNLVKVNGKWLHLDLTWDDPINNENQNDISILFFLIDDNRLFELDKKQHNFDKNVYLEKK